MSCEHEQQRLTRRVVRGGAVQYTYQCVTCGWALKQPIPHHRVRAEFPGVEIPDFDEGLERRHMDERLAAQQAKREAESAASRAAFFLQYDTYLKSDAWAAKRKLVLARCCDRCEGCGSAAATEVHHLTYDHVYAEFLFELVGLCKPCHERVHADDAARE